MAVKITCKFALIMFSLVSGYSRKCNEKLAFVCETLNVTSAEKGDTKPHSPDVKCEGSVRQFRNKCYQILSEPYIGSFTKASELCERMQGSLLTISDQAEQDFITTTLLPQLPGQPERMWIGLKLGSQDFEWVDNSSLSFRNFNSVLYGQERTFIQDEPLELCAYMRTDAHSDRLGTWDYTLCLHLQPSSVCQYYADPPSTTTPVRLGPGIKQRAHITSPTLPPLLKGSLCTIVGGTVGVSLLLFLIFLLVLACYQYQQRTFHSDYQSFSLAHHNQRNPYLPEDCDDNNCM